jgi:hypothetical protein
MRTTDPDIWIAPGPKGRTSASPERDRRLQAGPFLDFGGALRVAAGSQGSPVRGASVRRA